MEESIPYENAKPMYLVNDVDNQEILAGNEKLFKEFNDFSKFEKDMM